MDLSHTCPNFRTAHGGAKIPSVFVQTFCSSERFKYWSPDLHITAKVLNVKPKTLGQVW